MDKKLKVAFICNHNSCRSQMAEALGKKLASDVFESYSAGTNIKSQINQDAVRLIEEIYDIDMEKTQFNKVLNEIPQPDIAIFMGCNVSCPELVTSYFENWGLDDPTGKNDEDFKKIIFNIEENIINLKQKIIDKKIVVL